MLAEPLMFGQDLRRVIRLIVFWVDGPRFRGVLGSKLRDPVVDDLGDGGSILIFDLLQLLSGIGWRRVRSRRR